MLFFHYKYTLSAHEFDEDDARAHSMTTSPPFSMLAFFASSSIAFLAARRSFRSAFRLALPVRAAPLTRFFRRFVPRLGAALHLERVSVLRVARLSVFFFLFCHPGATMEADADVDGARASAGTAAVGARGQFFLSSVSFSNFYQSRRRAARGRRRHRREP